MFGLGGGAQRVCTVCVSQESLATTSQGNIIIYTNLTFWNCAPIPHNFWCILPLVGEVDTESVNDWNLIHGSLTF